MLKENNFFKFNKKLKKEIIKSFKRTKYCRFKASDRLKVYSTISNWTFTLISLLLIVATLLDVYKVLETNIFFNFYQISLAVIILVFFQVIANSNYELKSLRFHQCAIEISKILQKVEHIKVNKCHKEDKNKEDKIKQILNEYSSILKRYENHDTIDYLEYKKSMHDDKINSTCNFTFWTSLYIFGRKYIIGLLPQIILTILASIGFYLSFISFSGLSAEINTYFYLSIS